MTRPDRAVPELLSPAGSFESLTAAFQAGADAVYMGGPLFGARAYADNPEGDKLFRALDYAHLRGKKVYLTVNTLLKERELADQLYDYMEPIYRNGVDGVIIQDLGVLAFLRDHFPGLPLHMSTQSAVCGPEGARLLEARGVKRLVLPRELSLEEIRAVGEESGLETEVFVHGALCYCYSGRCLMSSFLGGRSGNRGRCAQPCRLPYEDGRMMNLRDLCGLDELPALQEAGVSSLKIEGRMKSPEYTAGVTAIYRKYLDLLAEGRFRVREEDRKALSALFDRGGFTAGYYRRHNGADMLDTGPKKTHVSLSDEEKARLQEAYLGPRPLPVSGKLVFRQGEAVQLSRARDGVSVVARGPQAEAAVKQPLTEEKLRQQISKTGGSEFVLESLEIESDGASFLPVSALNELRRQALDRLQEALLAPYRQPAPPEPVMFTRTASQPRALADYTAADLCIQLDDIRLLDEVLQTPAAAVYLPADYVTPEEFGPLAEKIRMAGKRAGYVLPPVFRQEMRRLFSAERSLQTLRENGPDTVVLASLEEAGFWQEHDLPGERLFDSSLYTWNTAAEAEAAALGAQCLTLPLEPHEKDLADLGRGLLPREQLIYGRLPLMISAQCLFKTRGRCLKEGKQPALTHPVFTPLTDRTGASHFCEARCRSCLSVLYNAVPLWLADQPLYGGCLRVHFTTETPAEARAILSRLQSGLAGGPAEAAKPDKDFAFTRGNYRRGVE